VTKIIDRLKPLASQESLYYCGPDKKVKRFAVISGGSGSKFEQVIDAGLDLFITGEPWESAQALAREGEAGYLALGHYNSEKPGVIALGGWLKKRFKVDVEFIDIPNSV
jgi:putative NIF3 family GTP cyclohydrolase 1 type 2